MCHGPEVLISSGLASGRVLAAWPGIADDLRNAGASWQDQPTVHDGNWISARDPHDLPKFIPALIDYFAARATLAESPLPRRMRWAAAVSRIGTAAALVGAFFGARAVWRRMRAA
jgi:protease I